MSLNQIIDSNPSQPLVCDDTLKLKGDQLRLKNLISVPEGSFDNIDTITINGNVYPPGAGFLPSAVPNKVLRTNAFNVVAWGDVNPSNLTGGSTGDVLKTIAPGTVAWAAVDAPSITPGLPDQILHTNSSGTASEWASDIVVPGTFRVNSTSTFDATVDCNGVLNVDDDFFSNVSSTLAGVTDIEGDLQFVSNSGTVGQVLTKTGASTQDWQTLSVTPASISPGTANQVFVTDGTGTTSQWSNNLALPGTLSSAGGSTLSGVTNITGNLQLNGVSGSTGQFLKKTGAATQAFNNITSLDITPGIDGQALMTRVGNTFWSNMLISDITPGLANQIAVTNSTGTAATWSFSPTMNGLNIIANLQFNSISGTTGQFIKKTSPTTQAYANIAAADVTGGANEQSLWNIAGVSSWQNRSFRYGIFRARFTAQNWNSAATTALTYNNESFSSRTYGTSAFTNLTDSVAGTSLLCNTAGTYLVQMFCCLTNGGIGTSSVRFNVLVNGVVSGGGPCLSLGLGGVGTINCVFPITLAAADVLTFRSTRLTGTDALTADATNNSLCITMMDTLA